MTLSIVEKKDRRDIAVAGLLSGVSTAFVWPWGYFVCCLIIWSHFGKRIGRFSPADTARFVAAWMFALLISNILMNWDAFNAGFISGWQSIR
jgi:hypothetical protein